MNRIALVCLRKPFRPPSSSFREVLICVWNLGLHLGPAYNTETVEIRLTLIYMVVCNELICADICAFLFLYMYLILYVYWVYFVVILLHFYIVIYSFRVNVQV
jgi:hypothetical protein